MRTTDGTNVRRNEDKLRRDNMSHTDRAIADAHEVIAEYNSKPKGQRYDGRDGNFIPMAHDKNGKEVRVGSRVVMRDGTPANVIGIEPNPRVMSLGRTQGVVHYRRDNGGKGATSSSEVQVHNTETVTHPDAKGEQIVIGERYRLGKGQQRWIATRHFSNGQVGIAGDSTWAAIAGGRTQNRVVDSHKLQKLMRESWEQDGKALDEDVETKVKTFPASAFHDSGNDEIHKGQKCSRWQHSSTPPAATKCRESGGKHLGACGRHYRQMVSTDETKSAHDLVFFENRNTPKVLSKGKKVTPKAGYGKVVKRRAATADEERQIARGDWVRVDKHGNKPGDSGYHGGSNYRPQLRSKH